MTSNASLAPMEMWVPGPLPPDVLRALERMRNTEDVRAIAVMTDVHLGRGVCNGSVVATGASLITEAVGGDIGRGVRAVAFDTEAGALQDERIASRLLTGLYRAVPSNRHPRATTPNGLPESLASQPLSHDRLERLKRRDGLVQLGTLGRGNHFAEFQSDKDGRLWLTVHSGSRAVGQAITQHHQATARVLAGGLHVLVASSPQGAAYLADVAWAVEYARLNRRLMIEAAAILVRRVLGSLYDESTLLDCQHNHVRQEEHGGQRLWVHRKGAMSAGEGELGIVPGSMGTESFHVAGRGCAEALMSSSRGAGRQMSRDEARRRLSVRGLRTQLHGVWVDPRMVARLREEAPAAYKDVHAVMRAQRELTRITRRLRPVLCYKGV